MSKPQNSLRIDVPDELLPELLTESEWRMIKQRMFIMRLLTQGLSIRQIADQAGVGTDTVVRMARKLQNSAILRKTFQPGSASTSKWVFGQVSQEE